MSNMENFVENLLRKEVEKESESWTEGHISLSETFPRVCGCRFLLFQHRDPQIVVALLLVGWINNS